MSIFSIVQISASAAKPGSSEANEKQMACYDYKEQDLMDSKRLLVNCAEYMYSDYNTVEEFVTEEHPELIPSSK
jgi:hypothetical protein